MTDIQKHEHGGYHYTYTDELAADMMAVHGLDFVTEMDKHIDLYNVDGIADRGVLTDAGRCRWVLVDVDGVEMSMKLLRDEPR